MTLALVVPVTLALPVVSAPAASPHPVKPIVQHLHLAGIDAAGLAAGAAAAPATESRNAVVTAAVVVPGRLAVLTGELSARRFRLLGVTWKGTDPTRVDVRTRTNGIWSGWQTLDPTDDTPDAGSAEGRQARRGVEPLILPGSDGAQVRVATATGDAPAALSLDLVDPGTSAADGSMTATPAPASSAAAAASVPAIVTRAQWGADESLRGAPEYNATIKVGFVHHSASPNSYWQKSGWTMADAARDIRSIYAYYTGSMGYRDIPYNFFVDQAGRIYEGRYGGVDKPVTGAHTGGFNTDTFAVAALGNMDIASPTAAMTDSIARILAYKLDLTHRDPHGSAVLTSVGGGTSRYGPGVKVVVPTIAGHRDVGATACPGRYLYPALPAIRNAVVRYQGAALYNPVASTSAGVVGSSAVTLSATVPGIQSFKLTVRAQCLGGMVVRTIDAGWTSSHLSGAVTWDGKTDTGVAAPVGRYDLLLESASATTGTARPISFTYDLVASTGAGLTCPQVGRLAGADRYSTSVAIGRAAAPASRTVVLASGEPSHLVDGLVAAPLARSLHAPLLLTAAASLPPSVLADLTARHVTTVDIVGGESGVSTAVETTLTGLGATVHRISGADRYATSVAVAAALGATAPAVVVASGEDGHLVDALAAAGPAASTGRPILLVRGAAVPPSVVTALTDLHVRSTVVVGGVGAVSAAVFDQLPGATRAAGADRYSTSIAVADAFVGVVAPTAIAFGSAADSHLVDALAGGALGRLELLGGISGPTSGQAAWVRAHVVTSAWVLGGTAGVNDTGLVTLAAAVG